MSIFRSPQAKTQLVAWHQRFRARIGVPTGVEQLTTSIGPTQALLGGPEDAPPVVLLHGALASSAHAMAEMAGLADTYRLIGLDVPGQSPMSAEVRLEVSGNAYGHWVVECLDALGLETTSMLGVSWGGFVALCTAVVAPARIRKLSLVVPAGLVNGTGFEPVMKVAIPMLLYRAFPSPERLKRFVHNLLTTPDEAWTAYLGDAFLGFHLDFRPPRLLRDHELAAFKAPVQVIAAERDLSFPGEALLARAKEVFPNLVHSELLPESRHGPATDAASRKHLTDTVGAFFASTVSDDPSAVGR